MMFNIQSIGLRIREARLLGGISQAELALRAGVSRATINALENGSIKEIGINRLSGIVSAAENLAPARLATSGKTVAARGKSAAMNLSFPYDWSNPNIADDVLILKVIERGLFEDIVRVAAKVGMHKAQSAADAFTAANPLAAASLHRMLSNIDKAMKITEALEVEPWCLPALPK